MDEKRIYVIVPQTVQIVYPANPIRDEFDIEGVDAIENVPMVHGRLIAQGIHVGRLLGYFLAHQSVEYAETTTIVLAVRNSKELAKVSKEIQSVVNSLPYNVPYQEFHDTNPGLYGTTDKVHTITAVGPLVPEVRTMLEDAIGHLQLY